MPVAEIFISAFVTVLFEKLGSGDMLTFAHREGVHREINQWSAMLRKINFMLSDAEDQQIENQAAKLWLEEFQDLAYDLDDVLDEFATEQIKLILNGLISLQPSTIKSKVKALLPGCCTTSSSFSPSGFMFNYNIRSKINEISTKLECITKQMRDLNLDNISRTCANKPTSHRTPTTSLIHEPEVCGRDKDIKEITEFLLRDEESGQDNDKIGVIPIVGMGGIGKTTLAQAVYNDENVKKHFPFRAWVCVSDEFDVMRITKTILEAVTSKPCNFNYLDQIQNELKESLAGRKFVIVLDDVWRMESHDWSLLKTPLRAAARGSKVVVTTRDEYVASLMESSKKRRYNLHSLPFDDCWSLFAHHAFENRNINENGNLVEIGKTIVEKCEGLPLSVRVVGGLLRCKESEAEWKDVMDSEVWLEDNQILPSLRLSYNHLPSDLKPCFGYCSIFPKDYEFDKKELLLLWIAEGFIQQGKGKKQLEDIGRDYFNELLSRSLFQLSSTEGNKDSFLMHDLINDLAQEVSGGLCFRLLDKPKDQENSRFLGRARYSSFWQGNLHSMKKFESFFEAKSLRTFLPFYLGNKYSNCYLANNVPSILFPKLRCLRVLSLRKYCITELPDSVGDKKHLRYLDLSFTRIETLPDWVQKLYNLQTLILRECRRLRSLPKNMGNLINLRYFDVTDADSLRETPLGIGNMVSLQMLSNFIVTKGNGSRIRELGKLRHIGEALCISGLHNVTDPMDAKGACVIEKEHLSKLVMLYSANLDEMPSEGVKREVLHMLQPHNNLKELHIGGYHGTVFPTWLGNPMFSNMVHIEIRNCKNCSVLPSFGQLMSLKKLYINGMDGVKYVGREFYGQLSPKFFTDLEILSFEDMPQWEYWFAFGVKDGVQPFANVKKLLIKDCPNLLGKLPTNLLSLEILDIRYCKKLVVELDGLVYPSLTSLYVDGVELPFTPPMINKVNNTHESISISSLITKNVSRPDSLFNMNISFQQLNRVKLIKVLKLVYLPKSLTQDMKELRSLSIYSCNELETLLDNSNSELMQLQNQLPVLQSLKIEDCPKLVSLFLEDEGEEMDGESGRQRVSEAIQSFMIRLESLSIRKCGNLERLPRGQYMLTCLVELNIWGCHKLVSLPDIGFPPTLRRLYISYCNALESPLPCWNSHHSLETLEVTYCPSFRFLISSSSSSNNNSMWISGLPQSLKALTIRYCNALESPLPIWSSHHSLETLIVSDCPSLTCLISFSSSSNNNSIRTGGFPSFFKRLEISYCSKLETLVAGEEENEIHCPSLERIYISNCERLKYSPGPHSDDSLEKLKYLTLARCGDLQNLPDRWFRTIKNLTDINIGRGGEMRVFPYILQEAGFLTNLSSLLLQDITTAVHPSEWGLHRLSSLRILHMIGPIRVVREEVQLELVNVSVFPLDGMSLPTSLTELTIDSFPDLERLSSKGFECLTSLQKLYLFQCPSLAYFPDGGFPDTLLKLYTYKCPLLDKKCEKGKGKY